MQKIVKKISCMLFIIGMIVGLHIENVHADINNDYFYKGEYLDNTYIKKVKSNGEERWETAIFLRRSDGMFAYCLQPFIEFAQGKVMTAQDSDYELITNMTPDMWHRVVLLSYYGYGYGSHTDEKWYIITQMMIWKTVDPTSDFYYTDQLNGNRITRYTTEVSELEQLVTNHYMQPSFSGTSQTIAIGQSITLTDTNGVLSNYKVTSSPNVTTSIDGNQLQIIANQVGNVQLQLTKSDIKYPVPPIVYVDSESQNMFVVGSYDPISCDINLNIVGGKIQLTKVDSETNTTNAQGQATLVGAIYHVLNGKGEKVAELTIGNDKKAITEMLPYGTYTIKEVSSSTGYYIDNTVYSVTIDSTDTQNVTVKEQVIKGKIQVKKVDSETKQCKEQGQASLVGAKYGIYDWNDQLVDTLTIGNDCSATSKELVYGNYTVKEISPSTGYYKDVNVYSANVISKEIVTVTSKEDIIKGRIKVIKHDSETKQCKAEGQATLVGAKYGVYDWNNQLVDTLTIGDDCSATSKELVYGNYTVKEISPSTGYYKDTKVYKANIQNSNIISITSLEDVIKNDISILKQYDYVDGNSAILNAEPNVTFEIYDPNGVKFDEITTDKNGYASITLPYGVWRFHQVNTHTGFEKIYDFYVTVDRNSELEQYYNILNNKISAYLQVVKIDSETGHAIAIANTKFKIYNMDTKQYVSQYVGGKVYDTFQTDETGKFTTYLKLEAGHYKLVEISSPSGYLIDSHGMEFTIGDDTHYEYSTYGTFVTVYYENQPIKGQVEIYKKGESFVIEDASFDYVEVPLSEVIFHIYALEDIKTADLNYIYYHKDDLIEVLTTDQNGYAISKELPLGKYYIVEVQTNEDYILDSTPYHFTFTEEDNRTRIVYETYHKLNALKKGDLEFTKTDLSTSESIPNTWIEVYTENDVLIFSGRTDNNGQITIRDLKCGRYYILEREASEGYLLNTEKMYFEILENNQIVKATMTNEKMKSTIQIHKVDEKGQALSGVKIGIYQDNGTLLGEYITDKYGNIELELEYGKYYFQELETIEGYVLNTKKVDFSVTENGTIIEKSLVNEIIKSIIQIHKVDEKGQALSGVKIGIYQDNGTLLGEYITDKHGNIELELEYGKYYFKELETIEGYVLNLEKVDFSVTENGTIIEKSLVNEKIKGKLEFIKVDSVTKQALSNTWIEIYTENNEFIFLGKTDEKGQITIDHLEYGKYYIIEKKAPNGYILNTDRIYFEILEDGQIIKSSMMNQEIVEVPDTAIYQYNITTIISFVLVSFGIGCTHYAKKKS